MQTTTTELATMSARLFSFLSEYQRLGEREHTYGDVTLSLAEVRMLDCVAAHPGVGLTQLSSILAQSRSASFQMIKRLTAIGLTGKRAAPHGHKVIISLTDQGNLVHTERKKRLACLSKLVTAALDRHPPEFVAAVYTLMNELEEIWKSDTWLHAAGEDTQQ